MKTYLNIKNRYKRIPIIYMHIYNYDFYNKNVFDILIYFPREYNISK